MTVPADAAGVAFTADPATADTERIVVEAVSGLGTGLVDGTVEAQRYVFARADMAVLDEHHPGDIRVLELDAAVDVASLALRCEEFFGTPQDIAGLAIFLVWSSYVGWLTSSLSTSLLWPSPKYFMNVSLTLTYWLTPSWASMVLPVVQESSMGSIRGASVTEGCVVPLEVRNQANFLRFITPSTRSLTTSK